MRRGVDRVAGAPVTWRQTLRAAVLAAGSEAFVSHEAAANLWGVEGYGNVPLELSARLERQIRLAGVRAHRCGTLEDGDVIVRDGLACASPIRLVLDLSGRCSIDQLGKLIDDLLRHRRLRLEDLRERVERTRAAPGRSVRKLRIVLAARIPGYDPGESALEARLRRVFDRYGFPAPTHQHPVTVDGKRYRLDLSYPMRRIYFEGNGFGAHHLAADLDRDARRQNSLVLHGWLPVNFTWRMTDAEIVAVLDRLYDRSANAWRTV